MYFIFTKEDKNTTLNLLEKQWIESNKNKVVDIGVINEIPIFNYNGSGLIFNFIKDLEEVTGLDLNKVSYQYNEKADFEYSFSIVDKANKDDILMYQDNYVLVTKEPKKFIDLNEVKGLTIGVLKKDLEKVSTYLKGSINNVYKTYENINEMFQDIQLETLNNKDDNKTNSINALIVPKILYLDKIIDSDKMHIAYIMTEMNQDYVLKLGKEEKLNNIFKKYYGKWSVENFQENYNDYLNKIYFESKNINEKDIANFKSKRYTYGFVENAPYDTIIQKKLLGYNSEFLKSFSLISDVEITYKEYQNNNLLFNAFNKNEIDLMLETNTNNKYNIDVYKTIPFYNNTLVIISNLSNNFVVNSLNSLQDYEIMTINNSEVSNYLIKNELKVKSYNNIGELSKHIKNNSIIALDKESYLYYVNNNLKNYKIFYEEALPNDYGLVIRDTSENRLFANYLNFFLSFTCNKSLMNNSYYDLFNIDKKPLILKTVVISGSTLILVIATIFIVKTLKKDNNKKISTLISKDNKMKYIDQLTSLKNRSYLNDNIELWDNSEVYPQAIIVVDLNNISYINDNYGHAEGDKVITEAANILILNQEENSDIIRTSGNEFLVYMVGHDEKEVISYVRKLNREFKNLVHNFGAAIGYSIITDAIKTIDDAINEATLDMRDNKELHETKNK